MIAWIIKNDENKVRGVSTWGEEYAWRQALNKVPDGVTMYSMIAAFKSAGWKCELYRLTPIPPEKEEVNDIFNPIQYNTYPTERIHSVISCKFCGVPDTSINGKLEKHKRFCQYRLTEEAEKLNSCTEKALVKKITELFKHYDWQKAHLLADIIVALILKNCGYEDLSAIFIDEIKKGDFEDLHKLIFEKESTDEA